MDGWTYRAPSKCKYTSIDYAPKLIYFNSLVEHIHATKAKSRFWVPMLEYRSTLTPEINGFLKI